MKNTVDLEHAGGQYLPACECARVRFSAHTDSDSFRASLK